MLIDMPTLSPIDRASWEALERYDRTLALGSRIAWLATSSIQSIREFANTGPCVCSTSWGKDSVVVAHLTYLTDPTIPIVWVPTIRSDGTSYEADATYRVRDAFLATHPGTTYEERPAIARNPKRGEPGYDDAPTSPGYRPQDVLAEQIHERYISGIRTEESKIRAISVNHRGIRTKNTCRPIARWAATDVFAYLEAQSLPVHPAYAATYGGTLDRRWLRVHPLRSRPPARSTVHGWDMDGWEDHYFPNLTQHQPWKETQWQTPQ